MSKEQQCMRKRSKSYSLADYAAHQHHDCQIYYDTDYRQMVRFERESASPQDKHQIDASIRELLF